MMERRLNRSVLYEQNEVPILGRHRHNRKWATQCTTHCPTLQQPAHSGWEYTTSVLDISPWENGRLGLER
jgi:hypothetical protein